ncbi:MAG TPA: condensation domain-containing protein, partial [Polyangiaceae bacterium]|nr:condensation domain-containing protein [Polyangiaceae bacterium]
MTTQIILHELKHIGAELSLAGDRLKLKARKGSIPGELQALIEANREPLIEHLRASGLHEVPTDADAIRPHPANEPARLSCAQQQIWFAAQLDANNPVHNVPGRLRMRGQLDVERLQAALAAVLQRHDALQSNISQSNGEALVLSVPCEPKLPMRDLSHLSGPERDLALDHEVQEFIDTPFCTTAAPLVRFQLFRVQPDDHTLAFVAHHIVFDGTSREILIREIAQAYRVKATGPNFAPHAPVRFLDFAQWHRDWLDQADLATERAYWSDRLSEMPTVLEFPPDYPRPTRLSHAGLHQTFVLEDSLFEALRQIATAQRTTLNMLLLASIELVLAGYSGQVDFGVGVPVQARTRLDCEATIGMFVNTVVMRSEVKNGGSFLDFLERVRDTSLDALD